MMNILLTFMACAFATLLSFDGEYVAAAVLLAAVYVKHCERGE